jgi:citrate lyase subunit beta/citryl-CoA lyase
VASPWFAEDIRDGLCEGLDGVVVPKLDRVTQVETLVRALAVAGYPDLPVIAGIETALGVADVRVLLSHPRIAAGYFGAEDFTADMGGIRTQGNLEVLYARSQVALAGRLAGVPTLDQVVTDFRNDEAFEHEIHEARALGFQGKLCIHPRQVGLSNQGFLPTPAEVDHARRLLDAYERESATGIGAIEFEGQMVDEPLASRARQILAAAGDVEKRQ